MSTTPLTTLLSTPISQPLPPSSLHPHLSSPPWRQIPGTFNFRSICSPPFVKENLIYRSGMLSLLSEKGKKEIVDLAGVRAIFDLRTKEERERDLEPEVEGVESFWAEIDEEEEEVEWTSLVEMYLSFLTTHRLIFREIFLHVLRNPNRPFLVHCTAGKDRTGVAVALLLSLAGVPQETIVHDYTLTRIGIEPVRELLQAKLAGEGGREVDWDNEIVRTIAGCEAETMVSFLREMEERFEGGVEGFVVRELGFSGEEVEGIRRSLRGDGV